MPATSPCTPCCATPQTVNIPGVEGDPGSDGKNGLSAFALTTADFVLPADNANVTVSVTTSLPFVIGQILIVGQANGGALAGPGPGTFQVASIPGLSSLSLKFLHYSGDVTNGSTISAGAVVAPAGGLFTSPLAVALGGTGAATVALALKALGLMSTGNFQPFSVYGVGAVGSTAYVMTAAAVNNAATQVVINGADVKIAITQAGTYLIHARATIDYNGKTFAAPELITAKLRNTNTAADITSATSGLTAPIITTATYTHGDIVLPPVVYTTAIATDVLWLLARAASIAGAGTVEIAEASIVAVKLY